MALPARVSLRRSRGKPGPGQLLTLKKVSAHAGKMTLRNYGSRGFDGPSLLDTAGAHEQPQVTQGYAH